ncbi:hypothetical protein E2562_002871, partial [Oryza meyeriana var. granulata]
MTMAEPTVMTMMNRRKRRGAGVDENGDADDDDGERTKALEGYGLTSGKIDDDEDWHGSWGTQRRLANATMT